VPAQALLDDLEAGDSLDKFPEDFSTVSRKQAVAFIEAAGKRILESIAAPA